MFQIEFFSTACALSAIKREPIGPPASNRDQARRLKPSPYHPASNRPLASPGHVVAVLKTGLLPEVLKFRSAKRAGKLN